jgi:hypothetical protein
MTDNPYQPPEAEVRDAPPRRLVAARPRQIVQAIALLWVSTSLGVASGYLEAQRSPDPWASVAVMLLTMLVLLAVLTVMLWRGRNWARLTYLILVALSLASLISSWGIVERPAIEVALEAVSFVADAGSFFLMFTKPGSLWFQYAAEPGDRA